MEQYESHSEPMESKQNCYRVSIRQQTSKEKRSPLQAELSSFVKPADSNQVDSETIFK